MAWPRRIVIGMAADVTEVLEIAKVRELLRSGRARAIRETYHLSRSELARCLGVAESTIARWEEGERVPRCRNAVELAHLLRQLEVG
jgi:DNA-binding transcriptional regulator YiaG